MPIKYKFDVLQELKNKAFYRDKGQNSPLPLKKFQKTIDLHYISVV